VMMLCSGFYYNGLLPANTTLLTFCPGWIATNIGGKNGRDVKTTD